MLIRFLLLSLLAYLPHGALAASSPLGEEKREVVQLQIFLDQNNFGPGVIDGRMGTYTRLAIEAYNRNQGREVNDWDAVKKEAAERVPNLLATAIVPTWAGKFVDSALVEDEDRSGQSHRKDMPYRSVAEFMAERYHTSVDFLSLVNGMNVLEKATLRSAIIVPNVEPFRIENLAFGRTHREDERLSQRWVVVDTERKQLRILEPIESKKETDISDLPAEPALDDIIEEGFSVDEYDPGEDSALIEKEQVELVKEVEPELDEKKARLVAAFPITPGKPQYIRRGIWKMVNCIEFPEWRYDKSLLETGQRGSQSLTIPSGPNNPVGVIWMGLSRPGIGIHGTADPDSIGRSRSAGCIRLANWDAVRLPTLVRPEATVVIK